MTLTALPGPCPVPAGGYDLATLGYAEQEFTLSGSARSFSLAGERAADGRWDARPGPDAPFTTRLLVRRPAQAASFSGTVVVEWLNVSGGVDAAPDWIMTHTHLIRRGHAWVGVSAQRAGLEGGGLVEGPHLKKASPQRYAAIAHPGDAWSFDIFSQAAQLLRSAQAGGPLAGLRPVRLLAAGHSQSAVFLVTYVNAIDPLAAVFDGFLLHGRGAFGAGLDGTFRPSRNRGQANPPPPRSAAERIRDDLRVPVLVLQTETDVALLGSGRAAQPDSDLLRLWELAGAAHADTYVLRAGHFDDGHLPAARLADLLAPTTRTVAGTTERPVNSGPQQHYVACAAIEHLDTWAAGGPAAPAAHRLLANEDGRDFGRDYYGVAVGGIRTPWTDAAITTLSGLGQDGGTFGFLFGTTEDFHYDELVRRYPFGYSGPFTDSLNRAIEAGFLLADDRAEILALADATFTQVTKRIR